MKKHTKKPMSGNQHLNIPFFSNNYKLQRIILITSFLLQRSFHSSMCESFSHISCKKKKKVSKPAAARTYQTTTHLL